MTEQRRSYAGEHVYVGVDVHKETYTVTCVCHKQIVKTATVQAEPAGLAASLPRFPGGHAVCGLRGGVSRLRAAPRPHQRGYQHYCRQSRVYRGGRQR